MGTFERDELESYVSFQQTGDVGVDVAKWLRSDVLHLRRGLLHFMSCCLEFICCAVDGIGQLSVYGAGLICMTSLRSSPIDIDV